MNDWLSVLFFIGLLLVITEHNFKEKFKYFSQKQNSKEKYYKKQRSKSI